MYKLTRLWLDNKKTKKKRKFLRSILYILSTKANKFIQILGDTIELSKF